MFNHNIHMDQKLIDKLIQQAQDYRTGKFTGFTEYLESEGINSYSNVNPDYLTITNGTQLYRDRSISGNRTGYTGIRIFTNDADIREIGIRSGQGDTSQKTVSPVDNYIFSIKDQDKWGLLHTFLGIKFDRLKVEQFVTENIIYFPDLPQGNTYETRFLLQGSQQGWFGTRQDDQFVDLLYDTTKTTNEIISGATDLTTQVLGKYELNLLNYAEGNDFMDEWTNMLAAYDDLIKDYFDQPSTGEILSTLQSVVISSNYLRTIGFFNPTYDVNGTMKFPSVLEIPYFAAIYMGGLVKISKSQNLKDALIDLLRSDLGVAMRTFIKEYIFIFLFI